MTHSPLNADLSLPPEQMREIGYQVIDAIVEQFESVRDRRALNTSSPEAMEALFREDAPASGQPVADVLKRVTGEIFAHYAPLDHPRFFGFVPSPINFISVMAEALAAAHNPFMGSWMVSAGPTTIELVTIDWLRQICGLPDPTGGLFTSGGSMANLTCLAAARHVKLDDDMTGAVLYGSKQTHSSIDRGLRVLGFKTEQYRHVAVDHGFRMDLDALRVAIAADREAGRRPFCVIGSAGTTNTGSIDPLPAIADLCRAEDLWMHVDGAYGAPACLTESGKAALAGIERADSLSMDPHKWLFQPYEMGCALLRDRRHLLGTFHIFKDYMQDVIGEAEEVNLRDYGVQLTRNFRALKLWMSIQCFGMDAFSAAVGHGIHLAEYAQTLLEGDDRRDRWEVVTVASIGIICFRYLPPDMSDAAEVDRINLALIDAMYASGHAMISSTTLHDRPVLRICPINPRTTEDDIRTTIEMFERLARKID